MRGQEAGWLARGQIGRGGTAPVFEISSLERLAGAKDYDQAFSVGEKGKVEFKRIEQQVALKGHDCASLVQVYDGGVFEDRLYLLMSRAPGKELEKRLPDVPREKTRKIIDQIARAVIFLRGKGLCHRDVKTANVFISDDFKRATLLDLSVTRNIQIQLDLGPIMTVSYLLLQQPGTRHRNLFRLIEPGAELWHALAFINWAASSTI